MEGFTRKATVVLGTQVTTAVLNVLAVVVVARALGPRGQGIYSLVTLSAFVISLLANMGLTVANTYFASRRTYDLSVLLSSSLVGSVIFGVVLGAMAFAGAALFGPSQTVGPGYLALGMASVPFALLTSYLSAILLGYQKTTVFAVLSLVMPTLFLVSVVVLAVVGLDARAVLAAFLVASAIGSASHAVYLWGQGGRVRLREGFRHLRELIGFGIKGHAGYVLQFMSYRLDVFLVGYFLGVTAVGLYVISTRMAELVWYVPQSLGMVLFPRTAASTSEQASAFTPKVIRNTLLITVLSAGALLVASRWLIVAALGTAYIPSVLPLWLLLPGAIMVSVNKLVGSDLSGRGRPDIGSYCSAVGLAATVVLDLVLIPYWGISGAAVASSIAYSITALLGVWLFMRLTGVRARELLVPRRADLSSLRNLVPASARRSG